MSERHFFIRALGCEGEHSFSESNFSGLGRRITTSDYPAELTEKIVLRLSERARSEGLTTEIFHDFLTNRAEGIIIPEKEAVFFNTPLYHGNDKSFLSLSKVLEECKVMLGQAADFFRDAKKIHDDWEKIYVSRMDFKAADALTDRLSDKIFDAEGAHGDGRRTDRFLGAATADGAVDYIMNLTSDVVKRYFIKGRPGTGKSTLLKKIAKRAMGLGFDIEAYHCAFDPNSLDMLIIRELDVCLFDSTAPHEYSPCLPPDEIVDIYVAAVLPDTDNEFKRELADISAAYKIEMANAGDCLKSAKSLYGLSQRSVCNFVGMYSEERVIGDIEAEMLR